MQPANPRVLTINGGSSSIKFALFEVGDPLRRILEGVIERIGLPAATLRVKGVNASDNFSRPVVAADHTVAVSALMDWVEERSGRDALTAVGHRVVHGGPTYSQPQRIPSSAAPACMPTSFWPSSGLGSVSCQPKGDQHDSTRTTHHMRGVEGSRRPLPKDPRGAPPDTLRR